MQRRGFLKGIGCGIMTAMAGTPDSACAEETKAASSFSNDAGEGPFRTWEVRRGSLRIRLGKIRVIMRGPMFPILARLGGETVVLIAQAAEEGGPLTAIRSEDLGNTWCPVPPEVTGMGLNTLRLKDGLCLSTHYETAAVEGKPGLRTTKRWESDDNWKTVRGPLTDGTLRLPEGEFTPDRPKWFHGNTLELADGRLIAALQDFYTPTQFRTFIAASSDRGKTWEFLSHVGDLDAVDDPEGRTRQGWTLWGPCEPNLVQVDKNCFVCVMRLVNDDVNPLLSAPSDTYQDLSRAIPGSGIHPGNKHPTDKFYTPGPLSAPLVTAYSQDGCKTWSRPKPMKEARGCFPRMASSDGVIALTYGGLAYPRWGNCLTCSTDGGQTWCNEINFAPFFTTGYTDILPIGPRKFLCVFDSTPPQPWTNHAAHWVGAINVEIAES